MPEFNVCLKCPICNRSFWSFDEKDAELMIGIHIKYDHAEKYEEKSSN